MSRRILHRTSFPSAGWCGLAFFRMLSLRPKVAFPSSWTALNSHAPLVGSSNAGFLNCVVYGLTNRELRTRFRWYQHAFLFISSPFLVLPVVFLAAGEEIIRLFSPSLHNRWFEREETNLYFKCVSSINLFPCLDHQLVLPVPLFHIYRGNINSWDETVNNYENPSLSNIEYIHTDTWDLGYVVMNRFAWCQYLRPFLMIIYYL